MKKILLAFLTALLICNAASAIPALPKLYTMKQADGTTVQLRIHGDHRFSYYTTPDGYVVVPAKDNMYYYAEITDGRLTPSPIVCRDPEARTDADQAFLATSALRPADIPADIPATTAASAASARRKDQRQLFSLDTADGTYGLGRYGTSAKGALPSIGERNIPVIMVQFPEIKFRTEMTTDKLTRFLNTPGYREDNDDEVGSVRDYFVQNSHGLFRPTFDVVAVVTLSKSYAYYGQHGEIEGEDVNDLHVHDALVPEAFQLAIDQGVDFSKYVDDETGHIPNVIFLYAGYGEATGGDPNTIWPHEQDIFDVFPQYAKVGGYTLASYFVGNERHGNEQEDDRIEGCGVLVHELSHALGLPDLYVTDGSYSDTYNYGYWSVMELGPYNGAAYAPMGYTAYELSYLGWLDIPELKEPQRVTLACPTDESIEGMAAFFRNPDDPNEYFILENRQPRSWIPVTDEFYAAGLMLQRIVYDQETWLADAPNNDEQHRRAYLVPADREYIDYTNLAAPTHLFGNGVNDKPTHTLFDGSTLEGYGIYNITQNADGSLTFDFRQSNPTGITSPATADVAAPTDAPIYTISGIRLDRINRPGVYIQGVKKVVKK